MNKTTVEFANTQKEYMRKNNVKYSKTEFIVQNEHDNSIEVITFEFDRYNDRIQVSHSSKII